VGQETPTQKLTLWQKGARRRVLKKARKHKGEPLSSEDWATYLAMTSDPMERTLMRVLRSLPSSPRCGICGAPFSGVGGRLIRPLGYRPSRKNPNLCATCVELAPPGGMTTEAGILFADIRGFTRLSEERNPEQVSELLRHFYKSAERVLFPEAIIDKLIGDEVMALYLPIYGGFEEAAPVMLDHARGLLRAVGYGGGTPPFAEVGIGLDYGEAFVGNVGQGSLNDFTAVGDVVNVAARLQGQAGGGEIVATARLIERLPGGPPGERIELELKGKAEPVAAYRISA
jgi:adenylate cyclase